MGSTPNFSEEMNTVPEVPGEIVHHKIHLNADNINDDSISLNTDNLELVCRKCHAELHPELGTKRYKVDEYGNIIAK